MNGCKKTDNTSSNNNNSNPMVVDNNGNKYKTIKIGTQTWMQENLRVTHYNDGMPIEYYDGTGVGLDRPHYSWYNNDTNNKIPYGGLYSWTAVNTGKLCPIGWRIPTKYDYSQLVEYLGGGRVAGGKMKMTGTDYWNSAYGNYGANNSSGFSAVGGGFHAVYDVFRVFKEYGYYWTSSLDTNSYNQVRPVANLINAVNANTNLFPNDNKYNGFSCRCIQE
jgi:uncharacterized protein (TIGR02145 family)